MASIKIDNPERLFFTADLHFSHVNIIRHCQRPFKTAHEMDEALIANWNALVPDNGIVYVIGDMFWKQDNRHYYEGIMQRLNGEKHLIRGNHDYFSNDEYMEMGFASVSNYAELKINGQKVVCFHYPILEWNGFYNASWHLHGHVHGRGKHPSVRVFDTGVDTNHYFPYSWRDIKTTLAELSALEMKKIKQENQSKHCPFDFK